MRWFMKYGKLYKALIIIAVICLIFSVIKKQHRDPTNEPKNVYQDTMKSTKREEKEDSSSGVKELAEDPVVTEEIKSAADYPDISKTVPDESICMENFSPYEDDIQIDCFFTNTENTIDAKGVLPLYAQGTLAEATQIWFNQNGLTSGEIKCIDGSVQKTENSITFKAESADMIILFKYNLDGRTWKIDRGTL